MSGSAFLWDAHLFPSGTYPSSLRQQDQVPIQQLSRNGMDGEGSREISRVIRVSNYLVCARAPLALDCWYWWLSSASYQTAFENAKGVVVEYDVW